MVDVLSPETVHVLLVDDERLSRVVVANLLRKCNYKVTVAESGTEALEALQQQAVGTFQLVLTDVMMPQVGGIDLLRFIRSHHQLGDLPVVMMSASERAEMVYECIRGGAEEYLIKPVTRKEVQNIWTHIIRRLNHPAAGAGSAVAPLPAIQPAAAGSNGMLQAAGTAEPAQHQQQAPEPNASSAAPLLPPLASQQQAAAPHVAGATGTSTTATLHPASPPLRPNTPALSPAQQQQQQQQLASSLSMAATATAAGQQQQHHPWHALALRHVSGGGAAQPQQHLAAAALPLQQQQQHPLLVQQGEGSCCGGGCSEQPLTKRARLQNGSGAPTLLGGSAPATNHRGGGTSGQAMDWMRGTRGGGAEMAAAAYGGGGAEQLGGVQGGMMVEAAGRAEREGGAHAAPLLGGFGVGSTGSESTSVIPLSSWLARPNRVVQPKESFWIFTETLLLLEKFHAHCDASVGRLRPSCLTLSRTGRVSFATSPPAAHPHAPPQQQHMPQHHPHTQGGSRGPSGSGRTHRRAAGAGQPSRMGGAAHVAAAGSVEAPQGMLPSLAGAGEDGSLGGTTYAGTGGTLSGLRRGRNSPPTAEDAQGGCMPAGVMCSRGAGGVGHACGCGHAAGGGLDLVDMMYASPEEERGAPTSRQSDVFSLGVLFFELFHVANPPENLSRRLRTLRDLRQRILPPAFLKHQPKEAAFTLVLLHPDPAARPTVAELLEGDMFRNAAEALRARHSMMEAEEAALETQVLADFLRLMHQRKEEEVQHVSSQISDLNQDIQQLEAHLGIQSKSTPSAGDQQQQQQQQQPQLPPQKRRPRAIPSRSASFLRLGSTSSATAAAATANQHAHNIPHHTPHLASSAPVMLVDPQYPVHSRLASGSNSNRDNRSASEHHGTSAATAAAGAAPFCASPRTSLSAGPPPLSPQTPHGDSNGGGSGVDAGGAGEEEADATAAETALALWPRIQSSYRQLELEYFKRRAAAQRAAEGCAGSDGAFAGEPSGMLGDAAAPAATPAPVPPGKSAAAVPAGRAARAQQSAHQQQQQGGPSSAAAPPLPSHIATFADDLSSYVRYDRFEVMASLQQGDLRGASQQAASSSMVCCAAFDRDDEYFATVGVAKRIRIYELSSLVASGANPVLGACQYPVLEVSSRSRLSSVCWSSYIKAHLACSDYEGVVQLWDVNANSEIMQFEEHSKRVWSVDYSSIDPTRLVSGSDDGTIKIWTLNQESSIASIDCKANVCSVQFSPTSPHLVAAGTANCRAYLYDLRKASSPLSTTIHGHSKAVSYVRFLSGTQLVTASTDNSLKLWDLSSGDSAQPSCLTTYAGHLNERNFVGLSASQEGYLACGSETNEVYCYYKALPMPIVKHHFSARSSTCGVGSADNSSGSLDSGLESTDSSGHFVSSVCWARRSNVVLAANSVGAIKVLSLV